MCEPSQELRDFILTHCPRPHVTCFPDETSAGVPAGRALSVEVDIMQLMDACPNAAEIICSKSLDEALEVLNPIFKQILGIDGDLFLRPLHAPPILYTFPSNSTLPTTKFVVALVGTVVRIYSKRVVPRRTLLHCPTCRTSRTVTSDPFDRGACQRYTCDSSRCKGCELVVASQEWMDYTECKLQPRSTGSEGRLPRSITVALDDELSSKCSAGQLVELIGIAKTRWRSSNAKSAPQIEMIIWAQNIFPKEESHLLRRNTEVTKPQNGDSSLFPSELAKKYKDHPNLLRTILLSSTCPQLSGLVGPRMGILLSAVGGAEVKDEKTGHRVRGSIHCLLVGDPSTGKSQLLRFAALLAPRSVVTTGFTSSTAGLTAAATKEFGEWALEPGALVLSDGGTCVIDELRTVSSSDRTALHEAMEQQTISIAKAGLVTRLRTECTVVAACNPPMRRGALASKGLTAELGIGGPLLSRFDFVFLLWDACSDQHDESVASHIVKVSTTEYSPPLSVDHLCRYLNYVRCHYSHTGGPLLKKEASDLISRYYHHKRTRPAGHTLCDEVPTTIRFLESLIRITQSHARLLLKPHCDGDDASFAIFIMERTAHTTQTILFSEGSEHIRTGSSELDSCFLSTDDASLALQSQILLRIRSVFSVVGVDDEGDHVVSQHTLLNDRDIPSEQIYDVSFSLESGFQSHSFASQSYSTSSYPVGVDRRRILTAIRPDT